MIKNAMVLQMSGKESADMYMTNTCENDTTALGKEAKKIIR